MNCKVLLKYDTNFIISDKIIRKQVNSNYMPNRPTWYKILRLVHRGTIKYLSNKTDSANELLSEIKESLNDLEIYDLNFNSNFSNDIKVFIMEFVENLKLSLR